MRIMEIEVKNLLEFSTLTTILYLTERLKFWNRHIIYSIKKYVFAQAELGSI